MDARTKEAIRYLGYGRHAVDDHTLKLVESCFEELSQAACGRIVYRIFELEFPESGRILLGNLDIHSKNLYKNLTGCKKAVLLGATLGPKVDLLLRKYSIGDMARVVTLQACAAAMLEEYLDEWQTALEADMKKGGWRSDGQAPSAWRFRDLRGDGTFGAAVRDAAAIGGRSRQFRFSR